VKKKEGDSVAFYPSNFYRFFTIDFEVLILWFFFFFWLFERCECFFLILFPKSEFLDKINYRHGLFVSNSVGILNLPTEIKRTLASFKFSYVN